MIAIDPEVSRRLKLFFWGLEQIAKAMPEEEVVIGPPPMTQEERAAARIGVDRIMAQMNKEVV